MQMKNYVKITLAILFIIWLFCVSKVDATTGSTVFIGEPVILDSYDNIEITQITEEINEETSEIKSTQLFTNTSDMLLTKRASVKLEDDYYNFTINSLKISVNSLEISKITKEGNNYIFYFQIQPNEAKKIEISYKTDNNLQNARIIKYTMDSIKGKNVKLFQISVKLSKYDIPLVEKIWPGAYNFENNSVNTEYFDFIVNNLTSSFIIQKETYHNIKYGDNSENLSEIDEYILEHAKDFIDGNLPEYSSTEYYGWNYAAKIVTNWLYGREFDYKTDAINDTLSSLVDYCLILDANNKNILYKTSESESTYAVFTYYNDNFALASLICNYYTKDEKVFKNHGEYDSHKKAVGKMVAIDYHESEEGKDLYVNKDTTNSEHSVTVPRELFVLTKRDEYSILRTVVANGAPLTDYNPGIKRVYVNSDIDGNKLDISEEEIIQFINMMNVDLYIRIVLYDPSEQYPDVQAGYYTDDAQEIAIAYIETNDKINQEEKYMQEIIDEKYDFYKTMTQEEKQERIDSVKLRIEQIKKENRKFDNEVVANYSKVPTIAHCVGKCELEDGKYVVRFNNAGDESGLRYIYGASECDVAKKMLNENKTNIEKMKDEIKSKIKKTEISTDLEEYKKVQISNVVNKNENIKNSDVITINPIILGFISLVIVIAILFLIIVIGVRKK